MDKQLALWEREKGNGMVGLPPPREAPMMPPVEIPPRGWAAASFGMAEGGFEDAVLGLSVLEAVITIGVEPMGLEAIEGGVAEAGG